MSVQVGRVLGKWILQRMFFFRIHYDKPQLRSMPVILNDSYTLWRGKYVSENRNNFLRVLNNNLLTAFRNKVAFEINTVWYRKLFPLLKALSVNLLPWDSCHELRRADNFPGKPNVQKLSIYFENLSKKSKISKARILFYTLSRTDWAVSAPVKSNRLENVGNIR